MDANSVSIHNGGTELSDRSGVEVVELSVFGHSLISALVIAALVKCGGETDLNSFSGVKPPSVVNTNGISSSADSGNADFVELSVPGGRLISSFGIATLLMCGVGIDLNSVSEVVALRPGNTDGTTFSADSSDGDVAEIPVPGHSLVFNSGAAKLTK